MAKRPSFGALYTPNNTVFRVASEHAERMELCLFSADEKHEQKIPMEREGSVWQAELKGIKPGQKYGYRAYGEYNPQEGLFFNAHKLAMDPYALEVSTSFKKWRAEELSVENDMDSAHIMPKAVVVDIQSIFDEEKYPYLSSRPHFGIGENSIYETHIKNFSKLNHELAEFKRGRLAALADDWSIKYFKELGVNNIELMPINPTCPGRQIPEIDGRTDSWGYNPYCYFAIDPRYGNLADLAAVVNKLHQNGIKVTVDAVFNHTGEHAALGYWNRALSFKLLDSPNYYRSAGDNKSDYMNTTGCHNNFNLDSRLGHQILHDYINHMYLLGFDGIRWDLGGDNALDNYGRFQDNGAFIQELRYASEKLNMEMYVEPWSAMGGNFTGRFANLVPGVKEWSDKRRDFTADFFSSRENVAGEFGNQVSGSAITDVKNGKSAVVGTAFTHDGFSLVGAFKHPKDTTPNGEEGRDGSADNYRKSYNDEELFRRAASAAALNILSKGIPLLRNGDELSYASPNNNPYCIDDESVWLKWKELDGNEKKLFKQICRLNALRREHPVFTDLSLYTGQVMQENGVKDITWLRPDSSEMTENEWRQPFHKTGAYMLNGAGNGKRKADDDFLIMASGDNYYTINYKLPTPPSGGKWQLVLDTSKGEFEKAVQYLDSGSEYALKPYSFVILTCKRERQDVNEKRLTDIMMHKKSDHTR